MKPDNCPHTKIRPVTNWLNAYVSRCMACGKVAPNSDFDEEQVLRQKAPMIGPESESARTACLLTPGQIKNWRTVLLKMLGPYALLMPEDQIQRFRDKMQEWANEERIPSD